MESFNNDPLSSSPEPTQAYKGLTQKLPPTMTRYVAMLLSLDEINKFYNIVAAVSTWLILAAFLVLPGTFTSFKDSEVFQDASDGNKGSLAHQIIQSAAHIGLLWVSGIFCIIGAVGCIFCWFRWRKNYVWLMNKVFTPGLLNSFAGLLTTIINVYTAQKGVWSVTAKITAIVAGAAVGVTGILCILYTLALDKVMAKHERVMDAAYRSKYEKIGGTFSKVRLPLKRGGSADS